MAKKKTRKEKIKEQELLPREQKPTKKGLKKSKSFWNLKNILPILAILIITFICFSPSLQSEFVNWDDDKNFYENQHIISLTDNNFWSNTLEIFSNKVIGNYNPLATWTFLIENRIFGLDNPMPWHLNNILLHLLCVFLVYRISLLLKLNWKAASFVALLFAIHPLRVESVAWVTERKDVLFGVFYFSALLYYIKSKKSGKSYIVPILILFVLALFSKIQAVMLPLSMICIDYYFDKKITLEMIKGKWFYFALSLAFGLYGLFALQDHGSLEATTDYEPWQRIFVGSYAYLTYLVKSIVPYRMSPLYPYPNVFPALLYPTILSFIAGISLLLYGYKKKWKAITFGLAFFSVNIVFLLQILGAGQGYLADRFTYIAYFGLFFIFGYFFQKAMENGKLRIPISIGAAALFMAYGFMTFQQNKVWTNSGTLWTHVLKYYDNITLPFGNRANYYRDTGQAQKALADYSASINLDPTDAGPFNSRAKLYFNSTEQSNWLLALDDYNRAIEIDPDNGEYHVNKGAIYAKMNNLDQAILSFNRGIELKPDHAVGYLNRSVLHNMKGDIPKALQDIQSYLKLNPYSADLWYESAICRRKIGQDQASIADFDKAIKFNGNKGLYYYERSKAHYTLGNKNQAKTDYNEALQRGQQRDSTLENLLK